jgi:hypothetical protein
MPSRSRAERLSKPLGLASGVTVHDQVNVETVRHVALDPTQLGRETRGREGGSETPDDLACRPRGPRADVRFGRDSISFQAVRFICSNPHGRKAATPVARANVADPPAKVSFRFRSGL